jgi:hypothetical protein
VTLRLVERATKVFQPLKSTVAGLLGVVDTVEVELILCPFPDNNHSKIAFKFSLTL